MVESRSSNDQPEHQGDRDGDDEDADHRRVLDAPGVDDETEGLSLIHI